jgi:potassium/hydrogen antiporter
MNPTLILAALAALVFIGFALEELFRRTGIPDVLVLLIFGIVLGALGVIDLEKVRGFDRVFTTAALVLILFEGAVRMRLGELKTALRGSLALTISNFAFSIMGVFLLSMLVFGMAPLSALIFGVIMGGTSSAVVIPMVGLLRMRQETRTSLSLESALSDVLCIVFALALVGAATAGALSWKAIGLDLGWGLLGALVIGGGAGAGWAIGLRKLRQRRSSFLAVGAAVFLVYAVGEALGTFGAIAVLAFGIVLGNATTLARSLPARELEVSEGERFFLAEVAFLLKLLFFVYLGARLDLRGYQPIVFGVVVTAIILAARIPVVHLSLRPNVTPRRDAIIGAVLAPKGLAASVLAGLPKQAGLSEGAFIEATTFGVVFFSIVAASVLVFFLDRPFISRGYGRFFRRYQEQLPDQSGRVPAMDLTPAPTPPPVQVRDPF